jgi:hypothetical protein
MRQKQEAKPDRCAAKLVSALRDFKTCLRQAASSSARGVPICAASRRSDLSSSAAASAASIAAAARS